MPYIPKWIADSMESLLPSKFMNASVDSSVYISPEIKNIVFTANLKEVDFYPGAAVNFRISPNDFRHYTISSFDREAGTFEIIFHIHGNGPGSDLASQLKAGDHLKITVPGGRKLYHKEKERHFFFGDETSLSLYVALMQEMEKTGQSCTGVLELSEQNMEVPALLGFEAMVVLKIADHPAQQAISYLQSIAEQDTVLNSAFYLTGNVASVQEFRKTLKRMGVSSKNIMFQGYWAEGSAGL
ncbi:NADPH-dependent ferric siderophore reductase [Pedobacter cryoconitis]|uniref:NADPH-dependent ferric siderophore reductase n=1 Tax=Pedobacter cryoconitis TaxID=188932 RepID=A0A7W8YR45_9SPHI|nr:siderophore-interacting protein [Pedobacter cryoconitis]MBB5620292.1 NADPH-dependent ferric siderophore reductase [Pedobacter cryoconitis]